MANAAKPSWRAVSIVPGAGACEAAMALRGRRCLPPEVRRLPLPDCTRQDQCDCRYQHHPDRRDHPRRAIDAGASSPGKSPEKERRRPGERRERRK